MPKVGRPATLLKDILPENWKDIVLDLSSQGCSAVEIRAELSKVKGKFNHAMWYALEARNAEFLETIKIGKVLCQAWWEKAGRKRLYHAKEMVFETGLWYANMKNRFGWSDKTEHDIHVNINVENVLKTVHDARRKTEKSNRIAAHV